MHAHNQPAGSAEPSGVRPCMTQGHTQSCMHVTAACTSTCLQGAVGPTCRRCPCPCVHGCVIKHTRIGTIMHTYTRRDPASCGFCAASALHVVPGTCTNQEPPARACRRATATRARVGDLAAPPPAVAAPFPRAAPPPPSSMSAPLVSESARAALETQPAAGWWTHDGRCEAVHSSTFTTTAAASYALMRMTLHLTQKRLSTGRTEPQLRHGRGWRILGRPRSTPSLQ